MLALVYESVDPVDSPRIFPLKVALVPCRVKSDEGLDAPIQIFEEHGVDDLDAALTADRPIHLPVELVEADFVPVRESYRLGAAQACLRIVHAHTRAEGVVAV